MNYAALIQNRKSVREFRDKVVPFSVLEQLKSYYRSSVRRLIPGSRPSCISSAPTPGRPWREPPATISSWWAHPSIWSSCPRPIPMHT